MSNTDDAKPLDHDEVVPDEFEDEDLYDGPDDDGLGPPDEDEDEPGLPLPVGEDDPLESADDGADGERR